MFEIVGDDIAALNDTDLRSLVGLLCEAELRRQNLPTTAVTWGGNQNAKDGGLDVRVAFQPGSPLAGPLANPNTGLQVKKPDMPRAEIINEMKPKGILRPVLLELAQKGGAYVIVSAGGSTSDVALTNRLAAMQDAVRDTPADGKLRFDFFDRNRLATWVRDHAGLIPWVRSRAGKAVPGWQSYGSWSRAPAGADPTYLIDGHTRIGTALDDDGSALSVIDGINLIRKSLRGAGKVVRLVGLSGVGKTRLAEALFDPGIGMDALDPSLAIYTDVSDKPEPPPRGLASDLNANATRAILIVDNCSPDLHRHLSEIARETGSSISVLTIEYDIREDQPEGTDVFALHPASGAMIERLIRARYPDLSPVDAGTIAEFAGGNARIALALASRIEQTETVTGLTQEELFKRLFQQRHEPDPGLLRIAKACSLVYSFEGEDVESGDGELSVLASLSGHSAEDVYSAVIELKRRDLVQARGVWRAVLPHAIANRLAKLALEDIPRARIKALLVESASDRLRRSFSRRLGYLDDSNVAREIAKGWIGPGGLLDNPAQQDALGQAMLVNIAPVIPQEILAALEVTFSNADAKTLGRNVSFARLLRSLAYEERFFPRAVRLLVRFATLADPHDDEVAGIVASLFHIALSGSHASVDTRVAAARDMLLAGDADVRALGLQVLSALLKAGNFSSHYEFDFGARSRDYGFYPATVDEANYWFEMGLELAADIALNDGPLQGGARSCLSSAFRELWPHVGLQDRLDRLFRQIALEGFWRDGWISVRRTLGYDGKVMKADLRQRLNALETSLRPVDLVDQVRGTVIGARGTNYYLDDITDAIDDDEEPREAFLMRQARIAAIIDELGQDVAADPAAFQTLLPELLCADGRVFGFGRAFAAAIPSPPLVWKAILAAYVSSSSPRLSFISGFLNGISDALQLNDILDEALQHKALASEYPRLQFNTSLDHAGINRLLRSLDLGLAPIEVYSGLGYANAREPLPAAISALSMRIAGETGGPPVAMEILSTYLFAGDNKKRAPAPEIIETGRHLLERFEFPARNDQKVQTDYDLARVIRHCLVGDAGTAIAADLTRKFVASARRHDISGRDFEDVIGSLMMAQPAAVLDVLCAQDETERRRNERLINDLTHYGKPALEGIPEAALFSWMATSPWERFPFVAATIQVFKRPSENAAHEWTPAALRLLDEAPDKEQILSEFGRRLEPSSWSGSRATKLEGRLKLLKTLTVGNNTNLIEKRRSLEAKFEKMIESERDSEKRDDIARDARFE